MRLKIFLPFEGDFYNNNNNNFYNKKYAKCDLTLAFLLFSIYLKATSIKTYADYIWLPLRRSFMNDGK